MSARYQTIKGLAHDHKLAGALGDMIIAWAYAETVLINVLTRILDSNLNKIQAGYYRIPTFESRVKFINALVGEWKPPAKFKKSDIANAITKLSQLSGTRNHWVHGDWCAAIDGSEVVIFDHRSAIGSLNRRKPVKAHDVANHANTVRFRAEALLKLIDHDSLPS